MYMVIVVACVFGLFGVMVWAITTTGGPGRPFQF